MTRICNFPISQNRYCRQPVADDKPNCGRHHCEVSAQQLGQNPTVYKKDDELHVWAGEPDGLYCLIHNCSAEHVLYQLAGEVPPCCLIETISWTDDEGEPHRDNGPAIIHADGTQLWYRHGERYRSAWLDGMRSWYQDGKLHRDDGPAHIGSDGTQKWYRHGERHRDDGPAVVCTDGAQEWWLHGKLHRGDGPAVIRPDGTQEWWLHGELHREDGPAVIHPDGLRLWYQHGKQHRDDGPARIWPDGEQHWWQHDRLHRGDGPAITKADGTQVWYWLGEEVTEEEHAKLRKQSLGI